MATKRTFTELYGTVANTRSSNEISASLIQDLIYSLAEQLDPENRVVDVTTSTLTITPTDHDDKLITLNRAAGIAITLPAATGSGARYEFFVGTTVTSNNIVISVADGTDTFKGNVFAAADGGDTVVGFETASDSDTITLNGTTKGGVIGDRIILVDVAANLWSVVGIFSATGSEATPFSAAVS